LNTLLRVSGITRSVDHPFSLCCAFSHLPQALTSLT
jgi:hypothetical protein